MNAPLPPSKPPVRDMSMVVHCKKCGQGRVIASGYNAASLPITTINACLREIGWQSAPERLCPSCACPMDADEHIEALRVRALKKPGEINFGLHGFRDKMMKKYNTQPFKVDNFFKHMPQ